MNKTNASRSSDICPTGKDAGRIKETNFSEGGRDSGSSSGQHGSWSKATANQVIARGRHQQEQLAGWKGMGMRKLMG